MQQLTEIIQMFVPKVYIKPMKIKRILLGSIAVALLLGLVTFCYIHFSSQQQSRAEESGLTKQSSGEKVMENKDLEKAVFAAGCFWGVQDLFDSIKGVKGTFAGYTGGHTKNPTYEEVCTDKTGHAEAVEVHYDQKTITYKQLLDVFFLLHDPTTLNRQGPDTGIQYRSAIFYENEIQKKEALELIAALEKRKEFPSKLVTEVVPLSVFYKAEEYHQKYFKKHGLAGCHVFRK